MYNQILFPTDGSEASERALEHAINLALEYDATLHLLNVIDAALFAADVETGTLVQTYQEFGERAVTDAAEMAHERSIETLTEVVTGPPHKEILEYAEENEIDLIVMGTHGRTGLDRYLLGSVTEKIVRLSPAPVLTIRTNSD